MHALLDVAEVMHIETLNQEQLNAYYRDLYRPEVRQGVLEQPDPPGFSREEQLASFDAFAQMAGGME